MKNIYNPYSTQTRKGDRVTNKDLVGWRKRVTARIVKLLLTF